MCALPYIGTSHHSCRDDRSRVSYVHSTCSSSSDPKLPPQYGDAISRQQHKSNQYKDAAVGRMVRYYFALAYKMVKMSKSAFLLQMEASQSEKLS